MTGGNGDPGEQALEPDQRLRPLYLPAADCILYYAAKCQCHEQEIDDVLTVFIADHDQSVVGVRIKDVNQIMRVDNEEGPE